MLLGHSMGALAATIVAARHPDLVSKLVLEDAPFPLQKIPFLSKVLVPSWLRGWKKNDGKTPEQLRLEGKAGNPTWSDEELDLWVNGEKEFARNLKTIELKRIDFAMDWASLFQRITCPVLLISPSNGILRLKAARKLVPAFSGTTVEIAYIEHARHVIHRDQFAKYMDALKAFCIR
jgi:pimeloyl-ACP methyl ester carboxylesterase